MATVAHREESRRSVRHAPKIGTRSSEHPGPRNALIGRIQHQPVVAHDDLGAARGGHAVQAFRGGQRVAQRPVPACQRGRVIVFDGQRVRGGVAQRPVGRGAEGEHHRFIGLHLRIIHDGDRDHFPPLTGGKHQRRRHAGVVRARRGRAAGGGHRDRDRVGARPSQFHFHIHRAHVFVHRLPVMSKRDGWRGVIISDTDGVNANAADAPAGGRIQGQDDVFPGVVGSVHNRCERYDLHRLSWIERECRGHCRLIIRAAHGRAAGC